MSDRQPTEDDAEVQVVGLRFTHIPEWVLYHPDLGDAAVRVYGVLARFGGCDEIRPSHALIGQKIGKSPEAVRRAILQLQEVGAVVVTTRKEGRVNLPNLYTLVAEPQTRKPRSRVASHLRSPQKRGEGGLKSEAQEKEEEREGNQVAPAERRSDVVSHWGADPKPEPEPISTAVRVVDHFLTEWHATVQKRPEYGMLQRCPNKMLAYRWLNTHYFKPKKSDPRPYEYVIAMVDDFMQRVRTDQISPAAGLSAWQSFERSAAKLNSAVVVKRSTPNPKHTILPAWDALPEEL